MKREGVMRLIDVLDSMMNLSLLVLYVVIFLVIGR